MTALHSFNEIASMRIELTDTAPLIWREVDVPTSLTLRTLHEVIQVTMGWLDYHLWEFTLGDQRYGYLITKTGVGCHVVTPQKPDCAIF